MIQNYKTSKSKQIQVQSSPQPLCGTGPRQNYHHLGVKQSMPLKHRGLAVVSFTSVNVAHLTISTSDQWYLNIMLQRYKLHFCPWPEYFQG